MKNYQDVINDRFDQETDTENSIYSPDHPIGKYIRRIIFKGLNDFLIMYSKENGALNTSKLLDIGCGNGGMLEYFISKGFFAQNSVGMDLSKKRIDNARKRNSEIKFILDDIVNFSLNDQKFDLITAFDLFSHLTSKDQIIRGLSNVYNHLDEGGMFLWYDIYSKDHFTPAKDADSWGFNKDQMKSLSEQAGFQLVYQKSFFKNFFNRYHSAYQVKRLSPGVVSILEIILPGVPGNIMMVFKK